MFDLKESIKLKIRIALAGVGCHKCEKSNEEDFSEMAASENIVNALADDILVDVQKYDKYRWHDLRKDPNDLPVFVAGTSEREYSEAVEVVSDENVYDTAIYVANRSNRYSPEHKEGYFIFGDDEIMEGTAWDGAVSNEKIVAWRYVKPFKEV